MEESRLGLIHVNGHVNRVFESSSMTPNHLEWLLILFFSREPVTSLLESYQTSPSQGCHTPALACSHNRWACPYLDSSRAGSAKGARAQLVQLAHRTDPDPRGPGKRGLLPGVLESVCCFVYLKPTPKVYRVPRVPLDSPGPRYSPFTSSRLSVKG